MLSENTKLDQQQLHTKVEALKQQYCSVFKPWFKIKVRDTFNPNNQANLTLFDISEDGYDFVQEGERLRIINAQAQVIQTNYKNARYLGTN